MHPCENKAKACDTPLCDTISKGYCAIWGGISHWAAKPTYHFWQFSRFPDPEILPRSHQNGIPKNSSCARLCCKTCVVHPVFARVVRELGLGSLFPLREHKIPPPRKLRKITIWPTQDFPQSTEKVLKIYKKRNF